MTQETALQVEDTENREVAETGAERTRDRLAFVPRADIFETDEGIALLANMPGVDVNSLDVTRENNILSIDGHVETLQPEGYGLAYAEYQVGDYQRALNVSDQIDPDGIDATIRDGVLRLYLPKVTEARKRIIAINPGWRQRTN